MKMLFKSTGIFWPCKCHTDKNSCGRTRNTSMLSLSIKACIFHEPEYCPPGRNINQAIILLLFLRGRLLCYDYLLGALF